jgi:hypothetical protein
MSIGLKPSKGTGRGLCAGTKERPADRNAFALPKSINDHRYLRLRDGSPAAAAPRRIILELKSPVAALGASVLPLHRSVIRRAGPLTLRRRDAPAFPRDHTSLATAGRIGASGGCVRHRAGALWPGVPGNSIEVEASVVEVLHGALGPCPGEVGEVDVADR